LHCKLTNDVVQEKKQKTSDSAAGLMLPLVSQLSTGVCCDETLVINACPVVTGRDFNVRFQLAADPDSRRHSDVLSSFDMVQHVSGSTHRCGNTLDLADCQLNAVNVDPVGIVSDHVLVVCRLTAKNTAPTTAERLVRGWRQAARSQTRHLLTASRLCQLVPDDADVEELFASYDAVLRDIADKLTLVHTVRHRPGRPIPWFDDECCAERRNCRRLERRYRRTRRAEDRRLWVDAARRRLRLNRAKYRSTGSVASTSAVARRRCCGALCRRCSAAIAMRPAARTILRTASTSSSTKRSVMCDRQPPGRRRHRYQERRRHR